MAARAGIGRILVTSALWGLAGFVAVPVLLFALVLGLGYAFDPRCGTPGDSGGCETGAGAIALASAVPAFALFFLVGVLGGMRRRKAAAPQFADVLDGRSTSGPLE